jgi:Xaa-Pro aminopeptidase
MYGQWALDWQEQINFARMRKERLERVREVMRGRDLEAIIAFLPDNIRYITGARGIGVPKVWRYCVLVREEKPILFELGGDLRRVKENAPWLEGRIQPSIPVHFANSEGVKAWANSIKEILQRSKVKGGIGLDSVSFRVMNALKEEGIDFVDGGPIMMEARVIKTQDELKCLRISVSMAEVAFETAKNMIKPGVRDCDVQAEMSRILYSLGCETFRGEVASGEHTNPYWRCFLTDRGMRKGDLVIIDRVHIYNNGYACDYVRTFLCGDKASPAQKDLHKKCFDYLYEGINQVKPGNTTGDVARRWREPEDFTECTLDFGHGLGLDTHEYPFISFMSKKEPVDFKPNMVLALEVYMGDPGIRQGVRLEENLIVTENGYEIISKYPFEEKLLW